MKFTIIIIFSFTLCATSFGQKRGNKPCKFVYAKNYVPTCPHKHTDSIIPIVYGKPSKESIQRAEKKEVYLGGCMVTGCDPQYYCRLHKVKF